ncbi:MAG: glycosyltransferase [Proteobacteria bacterium]|nr:glycosyltransferase [Pseudomonadota bacterium]MBU4469826.1 glycosyltransferase [Pseudomonadota bacterium]MCG2753061.1 glycosyltransferase [Desulfobacteraceae bacterium]
MVPPEASVKKSARWVLAYVETDLRLGHGETQCRLYVSAMLALGWKVILVAFDAKAMLRWISDEMSQYAENIYVIPIPRKTGGYTVPERWKLFRSLIEEAERETGWKVDLSLLTWFDGLSPRRRHIRSCIGALSYPWVGMYFSPRHFRSGTKMRWSKRWKSILSDYRMFKQPECQGMAILDEGVRIPLQWAMKGKPVEVFPEVTDSHSMVTDEVEQVRILANGRPIVGLLGHLAPRKGILNFLRAAAGFDSNKAFFLIAGELEISFFSPAEQTELEELFQIIGREKGYFHLSRISEASEFNAFFGLCDVHCLIYTDFYHSSGLLAKAAIFEIPVIVAQGHCMGERVEKYGMGMAIAENDPEGLKGAIIKLTQSGTRGKLRASGGFSAYNARNTTIELEASLRMLCGPR